MAATDGIVMKYHAIYQISSFKCFVYEYYYYYYLKLYTFSWVIHKIHEKIFHLNWKFTYY